METELLIMHGNQCREENRPKDALAYYAQAFIQDPDSESAWNNYGNVIREIGYPERSIPFLEHCLRINPKHETALFNLAVSHLLMGDYERGWDLYESRWNYEHLKGSLPALPNRWTGEDLKDKKILVIAEQGLGDTIQFCRFCQKLKAQGAFVVLQGPTMLLQFLYENQIADQLQPFDVPYNEFDYWTPMMSIPRVLKIRVDSIPQQLCYLAATTAQTATWRDRLGKKRKMRVGICWSGRKDAWLNQHKSVPFDLILQMIANNPQHEWINLQVDVSDADAELLVKAGCVSLPGTISHMSDTAGLISHLDVVVGVDTAVSHLAASMGRPTWIMLNQYAVDWRWLLNRETSPWYPSARLFRQPTMGDWNSVTAKVAKFLDLFKI